MNTVLSRYLARQILLGTALMLLALLMLFSFFDFIDELGKLGAGHYSLTVMLKVMALKQPGNIYHLLPIAALVGSLYALAQMAQQSELTVMRTAGLSGKKLCVWLLAAGVPLILIGALLGEVIAPQTDQKAHELRLEATQSTYTRGVDGGLWVRDGTSFINVAQVMPDASLLGIKIFQFDGKWHLVSVSFANHGVYAGNGAWRLTDVQQTRFVPGQTQVDHLAVLNWPSTLNPDMIRATLIDPDRMSAAELHKYIGHLAVNHQKTLPYRIAFWSHIVYPFTPLVMLLLALPFSFHQARSGSIGGKIFTGIMLGLSFHLANSVCAHLGKLNDWPPLPVVLAPSLIYFLLAMLLLVRAQRN